MKTINLLVIAILMAATLALAPALATATPAHSAFPEIISLPDGFQPEGIATGHGAALYAGSLADSAIYRADLRTGQGAVLVPGQTGRVAASLSFDERSNRIFVAGAATGSAYTSTMPATAQPPACTSSRQSLPPLSTA